MSLWFEDSTLNLHKKIRLAPGLTFITRKYLIFVLNVVDLYTLGGGVIPLLMHLHNGEVG